jgi:formate dehydrogenase maturation protein FdhE
VKHIESGDINLTQLNQAQNFFNEMQVLMPKEKEKVIEKITGKSTRESERILDEMRGSSPPEKVIISLKNETLERLKHIQKMNSHKSADIDSLILEMCNEVEKIWDPTTVKRKTQGARVDRRYISIGLKAAIWKRDQGRCRNCGSEKRLEIDHIKPFAM